MSAVVSDSGPLHYLILCDAIDTLPQLYGTVIIPAAVIAELRHANAPRRASEWANSLPEWTRVVAAIPVDLPDALGEGERQAISLALQLNAKQLLVDDRVARKIAVQRRLSVTGTVGIIEKAAERNLLELTDTLQKLLRTNFRIDNAVVTELLERDRERKRHG